ALDLLAPWTVRDQLPQLVGSATSDRRRRALVLRRRRDCAGTRARHRGGGGSCVVQRGARWLRARDHGTGIAYLTRAGADHRRGDRTTAPIRGALARIRTRADAGDAVSAAGRRHAVGCVRSGGGTAGTGDVNRV